jgi:hypothetical protein
MKKDEANVEVVLGFTVEAIRSAAKNASDIHEVIVDVACVDPKRLHIDSTIYGLKIVPVDDGTKKVKPSTVCTVGVIKTNVDSLSGAINPGMVTVNGTIDIPKETSRQNFLKDVYFENEEEARQVAMVFLEEEYNKSKEALEAAERVSAFLKEQFEAGRV